MKKILFFLFFAQIAFAQRTTVFKLPLFTAHTILTAGSQSDTSTANVGLNSTALRLDAFMGLEHDATGHHRDFTNIGFTNAAQTKIRYLGGVADGKAWTAIEGSTVAPVWKTAVLDDGTNNVNIAAALQVHNSTNTTTLASIAVNGNSTVTIGNTAAIWGTFDATGLNLNTGGLTCGYILARWDGNPATASMKIDALYERVLFGGKMAIKATDPLGYDLYVNGTAHSNGFNAAGYMVTADSLTLGNDGGVQSYLNMKNNTFGPLQTWNTWIHSTSTADRNLYFPDNSGTLALTNVSNSGNILSDSTQSATVNMVLYDSPMIAGTGITDESADYTEYLTTGSTQRVKVRLNYIHKAGIKNIKVYCQAKEGTSSSDISNINIVVGALSNATTLSNTAYAEKTATVNVSGLTANTPYQVTLTSYTAVAADTVWIKKITILAESQ